MKNCKANACVRLCLPNIFFFVTSIPQQRVIINDAHKKQHGKLLHAEKRVVCATKKESAVWNKRKKYVYI